MGRHWAWPDDTTPNVVTADRITCWLGASAGMTINRAQQWLELYAQQFESRQWFSHTLRQLTHGQPRGLRDFVKPRRGRGPLRPCPGPQPCHRQPVRLTYHPAAPNSGAAVFPPVPNLGIGTSTQDGNAIMGNATTVSQAPSAHASTAMDIDVGPTATPVKDEVEERATAELYS